MYEESNEIYSLSNVIQTHGPTNSTDVLYELFIGIDRKLLLVEYDKKNKPTRPDGDYGIKSETNLLKYFYHNTDCHSSKKLRKRIDDLTLNCIKFNFETHEIILTNWNVNGLKDYEHMISFNIDDKKTRDFIPIKFLPILDHLFDEKDNPTIENYLDRYENRKDISKEDIKKPIIRFARNRKFKQTEQDFVLMKTVEESIELAHAINKLQKHEHKKLFAKDIEKYNVKDEREQRIMDVIEEFAHTKMYLDHLFKEYYTEVNFDEEVEIEIHKKLEFFRTMKISKPLS